jgi:hypothetical protein
MKCLAIALATAFLLVSCAPTKVTVANYNNASIYVNGIYKGIREAHIPRLGIKKPITITAHHSGKEVGSVNIVREFDAGTFFLGLCSYGVGFFVGRKYPASVIIPTEAPVTENTENFTRQNSWDASPVSNNKSLNTSEKLSAWDLPPDLKKTLSESSNKEKEKALTEMPEKKQDKAKFSDLFSEENPQVSFDSGNKIYIFTEELEKKIHLFPKIAEFKSAVITKTSTDSMFLHIVPKKLKIFITQSNLLQLREKVDLSLK